MARAAGPLSGMAILVTRPEEQAGALCRLIEDEGGEAVEFPTILIEPPRDGHPLAEAALDLATADLAIFASANAVRFAMAAVRARKGWPAELPAFAVGPATAEALRAQGVARVSAPESGADSESLLRLPAFDRVSGMRVLIFAGEGGRTLLRDELVARGATVVVVPCYRRLPVTAVPDAVRQSIADRRLAAVTLTSSEGARNLYGVLAGPLGDAVRMLPHFVVHERIAAAARLHGATDIVLAPGGDVALAAALVRRLSGTGVRETLH